MKFAALTYSSGNIGDDLQTLAAMRFLPSTDLFVNRDSLNEYKQPEKTVLIMNGYFRGARDWPPGPSIAPVFVGFHIARKGVSELQAHRDYFMHHSPIGCRDAGTAAYFEAWHVPAFVTYCLTLTFDRRVRTPKAGKVVLVDAQEIMVPKRLRRSAVRFSHRIPPMGSPKLRLALAQELLDFYRNEARLVITTRLHSALPCMAMGIPVVFFGPNDDYRISVVRDVGGRIYSKALHSKVMAGGVLGNLTDQVDWSPAPVDLGDLPAALSAQVAQSIARIEG